MTTLFTNGNLVDVIGQTVLTGGSILVENGMIKEVGTSIAAPDGAKVVDLGGRTVLPGLFNCHVHMCSDAGTGAKETISDAAVTIRALKNLKTLLNSGVTYIRDAGAPKYIDVDLHDAQLKGEILAPEMQTACRCICMTGGHGHDSGREADGPDDCRRAAREQLKAGANWIKVMATGGVMTKGVEPGSPQLTEEELRAAIEEAHKAGAKTFTHAQGMEGIKNALRAGVDSIEHGAQPDAAITALYKEKGAFQVATLSPALPYALFDRSVSHATYEQQENGKVVFDGIIAMARENLANGIPVGLGTDTGCPYITHYDMWRELCYFVKYCGVTPAFALHTATLLNARLAGIDGETGSIEAGKAADLIVCAKDPLADLSALRTLSMVIKGGYRVEHPAPKKLPEVERELDKFL